MEIKIDETYHVLLSLICARSLEKNSLLHLFYIVSPPYRIIHENNDARNSAFNFCWFQQPIRPWGIVPTAKLSERYGQNLAAVSTNVREFVSGPILAVAIRENVWEPLKLGLIAGYILLEPVYAPSPLHNRVVNCRLWAPLPFPPMNRFPQLSPHLPVNMRI